MDRLDAMRLFVRLVERGSFSAAARDLRITQSTASKWVASLESDLGLTLIERTTRSSRVTEAGRVFHAKAEEILAALDALRAQLVLPHSEPKGRVRMSVPVVFGRLFVAPAVADFLGKNPKVEVDLGFNDRYVNLVEEGFDLAVRVGVPTDTSARGRRLADSGRRLVASPSYLEAHGHPRAPRDLRDHECLLHGSTNAPVIWRFGKKGSSAKAVKVRGRVIANNSDAILEMARAGLGVALLADWLVGPDLERKTLVRVLPGYDAPPAPVYALLTPGRFPSPAVRPLLDHLADDIERRMGKARR